MKKIIVVIIFIIFIFDIKVNALSLPIDVTADSVIVVNLDKDEVIYEKNPDKVQILASLTKIMTAYTVIENVHDLKEKVTITQKDIDKLWGFTCAGLEVGNKVSYLDLLYGTLLVSGADASQALAYHTGVTLENFNDMMNEEARKLGLRRTHFEDSYGGDDGNVSTAREMYHLLREALKNETFKKVFSTDYYRASNDLEIINYTKSIASFHGLDTKLITGNKSGYTPEAGLLLASTAKINGTEYLVIVCKSKENEYKSTHVLDSYKIFNYLLKNTYEEKTLLKKDEVIGNIKVQGGTIDEYFVTTDKEITKTLTDEEYKTLKYDYHIANKITPANKVGDNLGYVDILINDEVVETYHIYLKEKIFSYQKQPKIVLSVVVLLCFTVLSLFAMNLLIIKKK